MPDPTTIAAIPAPPRAVSMPTLVIAVILSAFAARTVDRYVSVTTTAHSITVDWSGLAPGPTPNPIPPSPEPPKPTPTDKLGVLFLSDSTTPATKDQAIALNSSTLRAYLQSRCKTDPDGRPAWRFWDKATPVKDESAEWQAAMASALADGLSLPKFAVFVAGKLAKVYPVTTEAEALETLRKWGGN